jgi:hypothetical protein
MTAEWTPLTMRGSAKMDPGRSHDRGLSYSTFRKTLHDDDDELHAFGVDDVEVYPGGCSENYSFR